MKPLKDMGILELNAFKKRLTTLFGLGRIPPEHYVKLKEKIDDLIDFVENHLEESTLLKEKK